MTNERLTDKLAVHPLACGLGLAFLIEAPVGLFLVDSGSPGQQAVVLAKMKALGRSDLKLIWVTHAHYDHYGSAAALRAVTGAPVAAHPLDADFMARGLSPLGTWRGYGLIFPLAQRIISRRFPLAAAPPDFTLENGETLERFGLDAVVLHTPGHTPGHTCLVLADGTAFAADLIARRPFPRLQGLLATDWSQLSESLRVLQAARPARVYTGHSPLPLSGEVVRRIRRGGRAG